MNGRIEHDQQIFKTIEKTINQYPQFVVQWYYNLKANKKTATTCRDFMHKIKNYLYSINPCIKEIQPSDMTPATVMNYFISIQTKENGEETSDSYKQCVWSCLNNFSEFLEDYGIIEKNLLKSARIKRPQNKDLTRINQSRKLLTKEDFAKIFDCVKNGVGEGITLSYQKKYRNRDICIMMLFMLTGIRCTALVEINLNDIDTETKTLRVIDKGHVWHDYALTDEFVKYYKKWLFDRFFILRGKEIEAAFISRARDRITSDGVSDLVNKYASAALGYHISPHKLRSGLASILYEETRDIEFVRRTIGHSNISTTQRYIVTNNKEREVAVDIVNSIIS